MQTVLFQQKKTLKGNKKLHQYFEGPLQILGTQVVLGTDGILAGSQWRR